MVLREIKLWGSVFRTYALAAGVPALELDDFLEVINAEQRRLAALPREVYGGCAPLRLDVLPDV